MSLINDLVIKLYRKCHATGVYPKSLYVEPHEYSVLEADLLAQNQLYTAHFGRDPERAISQHIDGLRIVGVPIRPIPYADDPKFKQLQSMARLASAEISFGDQSLSWIPNPHAEFLTDAGGWRYIPAEACLGGESCLFQIGADGLPLQKPLAFGED